MVNSITRLTPFQIDALRELGNIGAGNTATALAQFLEREINMEVPAARILPLEEIPQIMGGEERRVGCVLLRILGEAPGKMVFLIEEEGLRRLLTLVFGEEPQDLEGELERSALQEIANILSGSFLNSINKMTGLSCVQSLPNYAMDMAGAILSSIAAYEGQFGDHVLFLETSFSEGDNQIFSKFFLIPEPGSLEQILEAIGVESDEQDNSGPNG